MPSLRGMQTNVPTLDDEELNFAEYLESLGGVLVLDALLAPDGSNLGSGGDTLDATLSNIVTDANGWNFTAANSKVVVPSSSLLTGLSAYTFIWQGLVEGTGGGGQGRLWNYGNAGHVAIGIQTVTIQIPRASVGVTISFALLHTLPSSEFLIIATFDGNVADGWAAKIGQSTLINPSSVNSGSGTPTSMAGNVLNVGCRTADDRTMDGWIKRFAVLNGVINDTQALEVARRAGILNPT